MSDWFGSQGDIARFLDTGSTGTIGPMPATIDIGSAAKADLMGLSFGASAIVSAIGAWNSSSATKAANKYQAQIAANNKQIADWQSSQAIVAGQQLEEMSDLETGKIYSAQRATMAANGVDLSEGSPTEVLATTKVIGGINATTIKNNALNTAWGYQNAAVNASNAGAFYKAAEAGVSPGVSGATSLLTNASNVASKWYSLTSTGAI